MESGDGNSDNTVKNCGDLQNNSASSSTSTAAGPSSGCGCSNGSNLPSTSSSNKNDSPFTDISECVANRNLEESILVRITPTTGGQFDVLVCKNESVENFKKRLSKKLKVPKERMCLLHRDRQLREGTLEENQLVDGSRLTLLPSVETGLLAQRPEQSVMQALESLNDSQVNDFLSGKAPLNLTMRLGDHMMLIQLQLSTVTPKSSKKINNNSSNSTSTSSSSTTNSSSPNDSEKGAETTNTTTTNNTTTTTETPPNTLTPPPTPPSSTNTSPTSSTTSSSSSTSSDNNNCRCENNSTTSTKEKPALDTRALAEASRNLTQTLKQLSSEVLTNRGSSHSNSATSGTPASSHVDVSQIRRPGGFSRHNNTNTNTSSTSTPTTSRSTPPTAAERAADRARRQGAIIESMHHHGKGVYSGTFSGTLNPALQDKFGRPKRDISTIIHILNDLLCATPQYRGVSSRAARAAAAAAAAEAAAEQEIVEGDNSVKYSEENQATRGKLEQLRQFMEMRRQRRRARREARVAPYSAAQWAASRITPDSSPAPSPATPAEERPCEARASIAASATEETSTDMDTSENSAELCELNPEPVLA